MKNLILMLIVFISFTVSAQDEKFINKVLTNDIIEETTGYLDVEHWTDSGSYASRIGLPSFYDFDLVRMSVNKVIKSYSDLVIVQQWKQTLSKGDYTIGIWCPEDSIIILIGYFKATNQIAIISGISKKE